jgi:hypothetical protein
MELAVSHMAPVVFVFRYQRWFVNNTLTNYVALDHEEDQTLFSLHLAKKMCSIPNEVSKDHDPWKVSFMELFCYRYVIISISFLLHYI